MEGPLPGIDDLLEHGFRYALSLTRDRTRAEDLLHDGWLAILKAGGPATRAYLFAAIRSRFLNEKRRERLVPMVSLEAVEAGERTSTEGETALIRANAVDLSKALSKLRPAESEALFLTVAVGYTAQEVAQLTGQPRGTVLSLVHRARARLRRHFETLERRESHGTAKPR